MEERALLRAQVLIRLRRWNRARSLLALVLARDPDCVEAWCLLARCHNGLGEYPGMLRAAERALTIDPASDWAHRLRSIALTELGRHQEAVYSAREAVRLAPKDWRAYVALASALNGLPEHRREALNWARRAVRLAPDQPDTHFTVGLVAAELGEDDLADRSFREALALRPDHAAAINNLALLDLRRGRMASAASGFGAAVASDPTSHIARENVDVVGWALLRRAHMVAFVALFGLTQLLRLGDRGVVPALVPERACVGVLLLGTWVAMILRTSGHLTPPVRRYLWTQPRRDPLFGVMAGGLGVGVLGTVAAALLPGQPALMAVVVAFLGLLASFLASSLRYLRVCRAGTG
ncbi:hypothetical protein LI90_4065 [Carbonactinospora thermoautotrophica]|uniref:Uncharacterized protein n=1 Tax=Carbonactinospora thermoautotrophica TaxID=1469144 RepID=A0A132MYM1_9ACTN|nr:tetratricopeptide repeat protein [Carbonactinospora thermoautotrophica]KWX03015.1 hypothetical protein LI90_4065 [Carbonactinospora thermoautotrophica]